MQKIRNNKSYEDHSLKQTSREIRVAIFLAVIILLLSEIFKCTSQNELYLKAYRFLESFYSDGENDFFLAQVSFTFISVSVLSILSDKSKRVYWKNLVEERLVLPKWRSFFSLSTYAFVSMAGSLVSVLLDNVISLTVFFAIGIVSISFLSKNILVVYHDERGVRAKLEKEYERLLAKHISWDNANERGEFTKRYKYIWETMEINTQKAIQEGDYETVYSNMAFYSKNAYTLSDDFISDIVSYYNKRISYEVMHFLNSYVRSEIDYFFCIEWDSQGIEKSNELLNVQKLCHRKNSQNGKIQYNSSYIVEYFFERGIVRDILKNNKSRGVCKEFARAISLSLRGLYNYTLANGSKLKGCSEFSDYVVSIGSSEWTSQRSQIIKGMNSIIPDKAFHYDVDNIDIVPFFINYVDTLRCYLAELILDSIIDEEQDEIIYEALSPINYIFSACERYYRVNNFDRKFSLKEKIDSYPDKHISNLLRLITDDYYLFSSLN